MAEAEQPERLRRDREVTVDDIRQLVASATPHFSYQIRNRVKKLVAGLPADSPVRLYAAAERSPSMTCASSSRPPRPISRTRSATGSRR